jgi:release factor glutamine methyltransferase
LSLAVEGSFEQVIAIEKSPAAAALARDNVARIAPQTPVEIREGNLLEPLGDKRGQFSVIVSNPPYLSAADWAGLDRSVAEFEPREALVSGTDGLDDTRALLGGAAEYLRPGGMLVLEIDERRSAAVQSLANECGWHRVSIHNDLFGCPRYAVAVTKED